MGAGESQQTIKIDGARVKTRRGRTGESSRGFLH